MRLLVLLFSLLFMSVAAANEGGKESEAEAGVKYMEMTPKFTVNLAEPKKFLMINVQLLVEGAVAIEQVKKHMPALRHELIMLYSGRPAESLQTIEQREALRQETTAIIKETLEKMVSSDSHGAEEKEHPEAGPHDGFKEAYFTEFLIN